MIQKIVFYSILPPTPMRTFFSLFSHDPFSLFSDDLFCVLKTFFLFFSDDLFVNFPSDLSYIWSTKVVHDFERKKKQNSETNHPNISAKNVFPGLCSSQEWFETTRWQEEAPTLLCTVWERFPKQKLPAKAQQKTHLATRDYTCSECNKSFKEEIHLTTHKLIHQEKHHSCKICSKAFAKKGIWCHITEHIQARSHIYVKRVNKISNNKVI